MASFEFMEKKGIPYKYDRNTGRLFRMSDGKATVVYDSYKAFHIRWRSREVSEEEANVLAAASQFAKNCKEQS